jgi:TRAP-type C4-dicarboxylate transport system permease small subunit
MPLSLPVAALLFLQWPLRDLVGTGSAQANDMAQWLFALYVAAAVSHAQRRAAHLVARPDLAERGSTVAQRWRRCGGALCVLPWAVYLAVVSAPTVWRSLLSGERFAETLSPGYFLIKLALLLLAALMAFQSLADAIEPWLEWTP